MADSSPQAQKLQDAYDSWNKWARSEYKQVSSFSDHMQRMTVEEFCYGNNGNKLGTYQEVLVEPKLYIVNLFGQNGYGRGERQTNYAALAAALFSFFRDCARNNQDVTIRLPYGLGCGLAGGDWNTVLDIISDAAKAWNVNVEIWKL
jgi:hypothetical protein